MRRLSLLFAVLFVLPLFGSDSPKEYDDRATFDPVEGTWRLNEIGFNGEMKKNPDLDVLTLRSGTYTSKYSYGDTEQGTYRIDTTQKPTHLNRIPSSGFLKGETLKSIYRIDGDTLRIAAFFTVKEVKQRPEGFNDKGVFVMTYKRVK